MGLRIAVTTNLFQYRENYQFRFGIFRFPATGWQAFATSSRLQLIFENL
jgi:hypothetical protein